MALVPMLADHGALAMDEAELRDWGRRFGVRGASAAARHARRGARPGKTTLVQSICAGYGVTSEVTSPTFALVQEYDAPRSPCTILDLYRLDRPDQLDALAWDEILARGRCARGVARARRRSPSPAVA
jgi:tRNA threonylcarbamoyladenosine biosynthesis protein TsaE